MHAEYLAHEDRHDGRRVARAGAEVEVDARTRAALRGAPDVRSAEADGGIEMAAALAAGLVEALVVECLELADLGKPPSRPLAKGQLATEPIRVAPLERLRVIVAGPLETPARLQHDTVPDLDERRARRAPPGTRGDRQAAQEHDAEGRRGHVGTPP